MMEIIFEGLPDLPYLFLPQDFSKNIYPFRRDEKRIYPLSKNGNYVGNNIVKKEEVKKMIADRHIRIPKESSAGCVFKNILIADCPQILGRLNANSIERERFENIKKIPAGWLIEKCGLKGKEINGAKISDLHANFIVNVGGAKAEDIMNLIKGAEKKVREKFEIELELEIVLVGFDK